MKLEDQVCTLEQAKRLKELGIIQGALFHYATKDTWQKIYYGSPCTYSGDIPYPAFTVAELGVMLPKSLGLNDGHHWVFYHRHCWKGESVGYSAHGVPSIEQDWFDKEAEARADMLIRLLEGTLITPEEVNERLK